MRILVTGGAGFIGSHLVERLIQDGHDVVIVDDLSTGKQSNLNQSNAFEKSLVFFADIASFDFSEIGKVDYVFHLGAKARIQPSIQDPATSDRTNIHGTVRVLQYARDCGAKVIFSSSSSVYGTREELPCREQDVVNPQSPYALQKWVGELYLEQFSNLYGMKSVALRYFNVYGERQLVDGAYATVIGIFLKQFSEGKTLTITGDGEQRRDFTYVKDVVEANIKAMDALEKDFVVDTEIWNVGTGENFSINQVAEMVSTDCPKEHIEARKGEAKATLAECVRLRDLGWTPQGNLATWIAEQVSKNKV